MSWSVVIPVKGSAEAKSRLRHPLREALATAMALDTVAAVLALAAVRRVVVVVPRHSAAPFAAAGAWIVTDPARGLGAAIEAGLRHAGADTARAVLLGDLPALRPRDLETALSLAARTPSGFVRDAEGTGTTLLTALPGVRHRAGFGEGSAGRHLRRGYRELRVPAGSSLRRDVDTVDDLGSLRDAVGPRTRRLIG